MWIINSMIHLISSTSEYFLDMLHHMFYTLDSDIVILGMLVILLVLWIFPEKKSLAAKEHASGDAAESNVDLDYDVDYDFLATHDSTPAQFDLIIAYAAMDQKDKALSLLEKLLQSSSSTTRLRADKMMDTLKKQWNLN